PDSFTTALANEAFRDCGLEPPHGTIVTPSRNLRNRLVMTGDFLTFVHGFFALVPTIRPLPVAMPNTRRPIAIVTLKKRVLSPLAESFIRNIRSIAKPLAKSNAPGRAHRR